MKERMGKRCPECGNLLTTWMRNNIPRYKCKKCDRIVRSQQTVNGLVFSHGIKKRSLKDIEHSREWMDRDKLIENLYYMGEMDMDARSQALVALLFLTGARVSEICQYKKTTFVNGKKIIIKKNSIRKDQFYKEKDEKGNDWIIIRGVRVLKRREEVYRRIPISLKHNEEIWNFVRNYLNQLEYDAPLFKFSRQYAYHIVRYATGLFPHALRDIRVPDLTKTEGWRDSDRVKFIGWKSRNMLEHYDSIDVSDLMERIKSEK